MPPVQGASFASKELAIWLFSMEDKRRIVDEVFGKFREVFGFLPTSTGSYYMDAELVNYIKERYPMVKAAVATCWEEGPKAYHNANNSWYTLLDGGPWNPWVPSKRNIHCPASDEARRYRHRRHPAPLARPDGGVRRPGLLLRHPSAEYPARHGVREPRDPILHEHGRPVPVDGAIQPRLRLQHDVRRAGLDEQERAVGSRLRLPPQELRGRHGLLRPAQERGKGRGPHAERVRRRATGGTGPTPGPNARCGRTSSTDPSGSTSGTPIRGCGSASI